MEKRSTSASYLFPWQFAYGNGSIIALRWLGANAMIDEKYIIIFSNLITITYVVAYIGMFFYKRSARVAMVAISLLLKPQPLPRA